MSRRPEPRFDRFIPTGGDGAEIGMRREERPPTFEYLRRVVETTDAEGEHSLFEKPPRGLRAAIRREP